MLLSLDFSADYSLTSTYLGSGVEGRMLLLVVCFLPFVQLFCYF